MTRSGKDIFQNDGYPWLVNVESPWDIDSENYLSSISFSAEELIRTLDEKEEAISEKMFGEEERNEILSGNVGVEQVAEQIQITATDTAGYVTELTVGNLKIAGETFRELLGLPSSCFSVQTLDGKIRFCARGWDMARVCRRRVRRQWRRKEKALWRFCSIIFRWLRRKGNDPEAEILWKGRRISCGKQFSFEKVYTFTEKGNPINV